MNTSLRFLVVCLPLWTLLAGCGGGSATKPMPGTMCAVNSDCNNPLSCTFGRCHSACLESRDCPAGQRCVKAPNGNVCQLPEDQRCKYNSDCKQPLICARDEQCRNQCREDRDCATKSQRCVMPDGVCAEPTELTPGGELKNATDGGGGPAPTADGGATAMDAPVAVRDAGGSAEAAVRTEAGAGDAPAPMRDGAAPGTPDAMLTGIEITADKPVARQGDLVTITVTGPNLSNPGNVMLGDLRAVVVPGGTETMFRIAATVPHGAVLGAKDLSFTTAGGVGRKQGVVTVSAITAGPMGDDTANGSSAAPFKTFGKALSVADSGDTINLLAGDFRMGETWMRPVPDKVTIVGQGVAQTTLTGPGAAGGNVFVDGISTAGDVTVKNLTVGFFRYGVIINRPGTVSFENVKVTGSRADAIYVAGTAMGTKLTFGGAGNEIAGNTQSAIQVAAANVSVAIMGGTVSSMTTYYLIQLNMKSTLTIESASLVAPTAVAIYGAAIDMSIKLDKAMIGNTVQMHHATAVFDAKDSTFMLPMNRGGLDFRGAKLTLTGTTFKGGTTQVGQYAGESTVRSSKFEGYANYGYQIIAGRLDLGTDTQPGNNDFMGPESIYDFGLYDSRQLAQNPITCSFSRFNGTVPPAGMVTKGPMMPASVPGKYHITTIGNTIVFY